VLREAIISIEDKTFERNWGVNLLRAVGAAWRDIHSRSRAQGSSTLTMHWRGILFLSSEKTYWRKIQEILLAMQIERVYTKDQIFQLYANQIYLGHGTYGFEAASEYYFSKHVARSDACRRRRCWLRCPRVQSTTRRSTIRKRALARRIWCARDRATGRLRRPKRRRRRRHRWG